MNTDVVGSRTVVRVWNEAVSYYPEERFLRYISNEEQVREFSYSQFDKEVKKLAGFFQSIGLHKGSMAAIHMHNTPEYIMNWLALIHVGATVVPINEHFKYAEVEYIINKCRPEIVIAEPKTISTYQEKEVLPENISIYLAYGSAEEFGFASLSDIPEPSEPFSEVSLSSDDLAGILFTSGTTHNPKGAMYTHANAIFGGLHYADQMGLRHGDVLLSCMPCYHAGFQELAMMPVICAGSRLVMVEHYSARRFWKQIVDNRANFTEVMSFMCRTMLTQPEMPWEKDHCLQQIYFSMGLSNEEKEAFESRFGVSFINSYGMTETVAAVTCAPKTGDKRWPSVGRPAISYDVKIVDECGNDLGANMPGEICIKGVPGRTLVRGYYKNPKATQALYDRDGWLHTNDRGYIDEDGFVFFLDRYCDKIKRSGENVSSVEVECTLTSHPLIKDAAVIGVPDTLRDEQVKAFVQLKEGAVLSKEEIIKYCESRLSYFKVPTIIEFVSDFPRSSYGKIRKQQLKKSS